MIFRISARSISLVSVGAAVLASVGMAVPGAAQSAGCPIADDATVSQAVGSAVLGTTDATTGGVTACTFGDAGGRAFGVSRETNAFGPAEGGAAALAQKYIPGLPAAARAQIDALSQVGLNVALPDYEFESVAGVGDSALWVKTQLVPGVFKDSLLVQRGSDAFSFDVDDGPDSRAALTTLAQAVLAES
ncbi:MAG: hypothetical protein ACR2IK_14830 [Chloroflexota bacterium]